MSNVIDMTRLVEFSALEPSDLGYDEVSMTLAGLDVWDFIDTDDLLG